MPRKVMLLGRNGSDLRWCYREGDTSDEHGLKLCDVRRMRDAFKACGYDEIRVLDGKANEGTIINQLNDLIKSCCNGDAFVFYFSGHAHLRDGKLRFVLGPDGGSGDTLSSTFLIEKVKDCKASTKLIILDCCYAGEAATEWKPGAHENLRILAATNRVSPAGEFDELRGGVFTHFLHQALTNPAHWVSGKRGVIDEKGIIWSDTLSDWLKPRVKEYAESHSRYVGEPLQYIGTDTQQVQIAKVEPQGRPSPLTADFDLDELSLSGQIRSIPRACLRTVRRAAGQDSTGLRSVSTASWTTDPRSACVSCGHGDSCRQHSRSTTRIRIPLRR